MVQNKESSEEKKLAQCARKFSIKSKVISECSESILTYKVKIDYLPKTFFCSFISTDYMVPLMKLLVHDKRSNYFDTVEISYYIRNHYQTKTIKLSFKRLYHNFN